MTPLKFDKLEFARLSGDPHRARVTLEGSLAVILEALTRTGNGLGSRMAIEPEGRGLVMCPMEHDDD